MKNPVCSRFPAWRPAVAAAVSALALAGCATTAQECDPRQVSNVFTALSCDVSGGFSAHLQAARAEVEAERQKLAAARSQAAALSRTSAQLTQQRATLNQKLAAERKQNDRVRLQISGMRVENDRQRARVAALQEQLAEAERNLEAMQQGGATAAEIARLEAANAEIRQAIGVISNRARQE